MLEYSDISSTFSEHLLKSKSVTTHQRKLQANEMLKVKNNLAPEIMKNIFSFKTLLYSLRNSKILQCRSTKKVLYGSETISSLGPKIWAILTHEMGNIKSSDEFK